MPFSFRGAAMNNSVDSDPPDTDTDHDHDHDHACVVGVGVGVAAASSSPSLTRTRNPRKKRTRLTTIMDERSSSSSSAGARVKAYKRPDPDATKITRPCTECGKKFWSWKALFGHMRCHPERPWRGINPPPNLLNRQLPPQAQVQLDHMTDKDHEVAECLLLLASGKEKEKVNQHGYGTVTLDVDLERPCGHHHHHHEERFECSSCKKVFGSHQALGGHRASHKNVKGCFAITADLASTSSVPADSDADHDHINDSSAGAGGDGSGGHKCSICLRVFSTGQALGGHKRCHWEKADTDPSMAMVAPAPADGCVAVDLNLPPAPLEDDHCLSSCSSPLTLDLRLGL